MSLTRIVAFGEGPDALGGENMATVVQLASRQPVERAERPEGPLGEVVIFPGVRRERHDMDLAARVTDAAGKGAFGRFGSPAG